MTMITQIFMIHNSTMYKIDRSAQYCRAIKETKQLGIIQTKVLESKFSACMTFQRDETDYVHV